MNPIFLYQNEVTLDGNNKFSLEFIDDEIINFINFKIENQYYISSLDCNITKANRKKVTFTGTQKLVNDLSDISRELLDKGSTYKNDTGHVTSFLTPNFNLPRLAPQKYSLVLDSKVVDDNCYKYQFYDTVDKRLKFAKIYSPFSHLKSGLVFKGDNNNTKHESIFISLVQNYTKIRCIFLHSVNDKWKIGTNLYRDFNAKLVRERQSDGTWKYWGTNPNLVWEAEIFSRNRRGIFRTDDFMKHLYYDQNYQRKEYGKYKVIGKYPHSIFEGNTMPFIQGKLNVEVQRNMPFFIPGSIDNKRHQLGFGSILDNCHYVGYYRLTDHDKQEINKLYPNFSFATLGEYVSLDRTTCNTSWETNDLLLFPSTSYVSGGKTKVFDIKAHFMKFISSNTKYKDYLDSNNGIFYYDSYRDLPGTLDECEQLFDKDVLKIKKLVKDVGTLNIVTINEQLNLALYDDSNLIEETFIQRFNKNLQLCGFISIPFANTKKSKLISLENILPFRVKRFARKQDLTFELSYLTKSDQIATDDKKIHNFSIVCVEKEKKMNVVEKEVTIEGLQDFEKYRSLNPIDIKITDNEIKRRLLFTENRRINYRFIPNNILFSSSIQEETKVIFLTVNGLNDERDILINGKVYKAIGCIFTNEIEQWDIIKKTTSNWISCKLINLRHPHSAKHLAFVFDTTSLTSLLSFTINLLDQTGKEISFAANKQKVPALNYTIQIVS